MDVFVNNPPAQSVPVQSYPVQGVPVQGYGVPAYGYTPGGYGQPHAGGFGFVLLSVLGVFLFLRWTRFGGRRRWAMMQRRGYGPDAQQDPQDQSAAPGGPGRDWKPPRMPWARDNAAEIARERFARGEINAEELSTILRGLDAD